MKFVAPDPMEFWEYASEEEIDAAIKEDQREMAAFNELRKQQE